ncbi:MAG: hypothetical protein K6E29_07280 [Cyanobacteria bacterium RUI128]|nr:hypothetical protein [Cyanobacteria bacterium RUI128]
MEINRSFNTVPLLRPDNTSPVQYNRATKPMCTDSASFTSHVQRESIKFGLKCLVQQTAFNREAQTKKFVSDYIYENFGHKNKINIVSGGCSTGEEAVTYSMYLYNIKNKVNILGIDLGKKAIKQAKSRRYVFEIPRGYYDFEKETGNSTPYTDLYLIGKGNQGLTPNQQMFKALFNEFFEPTGEKIRTPWDEVMFNLMKARNGEKPLELDRKAYRLKDGMADNCSFVRGDIQDIDKILNGEKVDVISFSNALYHLTTYFENGYDRIPKRYAEQTTESLMTKFKNCLNEKGIVVFGEDEGPQIGDSELIPKIMTKLGFTPMNKTAEHEANVWRKG